MRKKKDVMSRVKKTKTCWLWIGRKNYYGYGVVQVNRKPMRAHRFFYQKFKGLIPDGLLIMHTCDNPPCVNPKHLKLGTKDDNNKDTAKKRRHNYGLNHWNGRLTDRQVEKIRLSSDTCLSLANRYKVSQPYISRLRSRKRRVKRH